MLQAELTQSTTYADSPEPPDPRDETVTIYSTHLNACAGQRPPASL